MAKITFKEPESDYSLELDSGVMAVEIREAYNGVKFITNEGATLSVCMRDGGFEISEGMISHG